ncbi:MAG TPA: hypothetical protein VD948_08555 [Rhodothermales bacterium]|nr:hypothetical protein [Rhodothermales bacterium]
MAKLRSVTVKAGDEVPVREGERLIAMQFLGHADGALPGSQAWLVLLGARFLIEDENPFGNDAAVKENEDDE